MGSEGGGRQKKSSGPFLVKVIYYAKGEDIPAMINMTGINVW